MEESKCRLFGHILRAPRSDPWSKSFLNLTVPHLKLRFFGDQLGPEQIGLLNLTRIPALCCLDPTLFLIYRTTNFLVTSNRRLQLNRTGPFATRLRCMGLRQVPKAFEPLMVLLLVLSTIVLSDA